MDVLMKSQTLVKSTLSLLALTVAIAVSQWSEPSTVTASCQQQMVVNEAGIKNLKLQCNDTPQQSWLNWVQGQSRSTQFHFIDLLELLNRLTRHQDSD
jgi:DMSO/TMAO reductase YedYZ molybdopterin-dependent catalytic subunit